MSEEFKINNVFPVFATAAALARAAGIRTTIVPIPKNNDYDSGKLSAGFQPPDPKLYDSPIGTPVYSDLELVGGTYTDQITGRSVNFPTIKFNAVIMTVQFTSRIIRTEIQGRNGTVKEYIGEDDAQIAIQGIITGYNGHYPADTVNALNEWRKAPVAKEVNSTYLQNIGIQNVVVENIQFPQQAGGYSYQNFTMNCISDIPVELKIIA
jgi:hypothetical protein